MRSESVDAEVISVGRTYSFTFDQKLDRTMVPTIRYRSNDGAEVIAEDLVLKLGSVVPGELTKIRNSPKQSRMFVSCLLLVRFRIEIVYATLGAIIWSAGALMGAKCSG